MGEKKLMLRIIDGGKPSTLGKQDSLDNYRRINPQEENLQTVSSQYRKILASRYVERKDEEIGQRLDWKDVVNEKSLLVEQARIDGTASENSLKSAYAEIKSRFGIVRKDAALYLAYIVNDRDIFGDEIAGKVMNVLLDNGCQEARDALKCLGFCAEEIAKLKYADPIARERILEMVLNIKK